MGSAGAAQTDPNMSPATRTMEATSAARLISHLPPVSSPSNEPSLSESLSDPIP